jgi:hypothetical protein
VSGVSFKRFLVAVGCVLALWVSVPAAVASPWAEVGDSQLRSDIQILANAGVIDDVTTHWPVPWAGLLSALRDQVNLASQPAYVRAAAQRVSNYAKSQMVRGTFSGHVTADFTNQPDVVRGFDAMGRNKGETQFSLEYMDSDTALRLSVGSWTDFTGRTTHYDPDGSFIAQRVGGVVGYAGYLTHWWGPGWISALSLSNNARSFPQVGFSRIDTSPFRTPLLSWLGPWQAEAFVGVLDDDRVAQNTVYVGTRVTFNPLPGLQIGLARTTEMCGTGHVCSLSEYFDLTNQANHVNQTNDEGLIDIHYQNTIGKMPFEVYTQMMNEDSNPIVHSVTSHLFGASVWLPVTSSNTMRVTVEYTDTVPTENIFSFGDVDHGAAYNNSGYIDGMHYRGQSLGFSLDSDSRLLSLQAAWIDDHNWTYEATLHHAIINDPNNKTGNVVSTVPVIVNLAEARVGIPLFKNLKLDLAARIQDNQPFPDHGMTGAGEAAVTIAF